MSEHQLKKVTDWSTEAALGGYRVCNVAHHLSVSTRWLEMYIKKRFGKCPHELFVEWRQQKIESLAAEGKYGKEMLGEVNLAHSSSLTRTLMNQGKHGLRELKKQCTVSKGKKAEGTQ